jgi:hypothetical protein
VLSSCQRARRSLNAVSNNGFLCNRIPHTGTLFILLYPRCNATLYTKGRFFSLCCIHGCIAATKRYVCHFFSFLFFLGKEVHLSEHEMQSPGGPVSPQKMVEGKGLNMGQWEGENSPFCRIHMKPTQMFKCSIACPPLWIEIHSKKNTLDRRRLPPSMEKP